MSLRPHFIQVSDVLVRGIARSTVKREMLRSLHHIAETIDAVMVAEGIEHFEDAVAIRELGLRYGQGYYLARPAHAFPTLADCVRAELRTAPPPHSPKVLTGRDTDDEDDEDRELAIPMAKGSTTDIPRNAFGRAEDEITNDFPIPSLEQRRPRASEPPDEAGEPPLASWQPLSFDDATGEALLSSLQRPPRDKAPEGDPGPRGPGLN
jgi:hypothetical protein